MKFSREDEEYLKKEFKVSLPRKLDISMGNLRMKLGFMLDPEKRPATKKIVAAFFSFLLWIIILLSFVSLMIYFSYYYYNSELTGENRLSWQLLWKIICLGFGNLMILVFVVVSLMGVNDKYWLLKESFWNRNKINFYVKPREEDQRPREDQEMS